MPDQTETEALREKLQETLARNTKATTDLESAKTDLSTLSSGVNNELMRKELEGIRERLAGIKTLIEPKKEA